MHLVSRFLNFGPKKILQAPQNGSFHFWKNLKKRHILCYDSKMMSKIENLLADSSAQTNSNQILIQLFIMGLIVFSHTLPATPELCKKLWPFELYLIRMIYKKTNLVVILYKIISYCRLVNNRELSWGSRPIACWYQLNLQDKLCQI